jgi:hypothetical protein
MTVRIRRIDRPRRADELADMLFDHKEGREFIYEQHVWRPGVTCGVGQPVCALHARNRL